MGDVIAMQRVSQVLLVVTLGLLALQAEVSAESIIKDVLSPLGDGVNEIEWVGNGGKVATRTNILLTTHDGSLFRSGDNGDTWMAQDKKRLGYNPASASDSGRTLLSTPKATWSDSTTRRLLTQQSYEASDDETYAAAKTAVAAASDDESMAVSDEEPATDADADDEFDTQYYSDDENEKYVSSTDDVEISDMEISDEELDDIDDICPSTKNIGSLDCSEGNIECEDLYSYCPNVAQGCLDMQCGASVSNSLSPVEEDKVLKLDPHPSDTLAGLVFITGMKKNNWVTTDGGAAYTNVQTNFILRGLKWHPYRKWALAYESNIECLYERTHRCFGNLMLSIDGGLTWKRIAWNIKYPNYAWLQTGTGKAWENRKDIVAVQHKKDRGPKQSWDTELDFIHSNDFFKNSQSMLPRGNNFAIIDKYIFVAVANSQTDVSLWVSTNNGKTFGVVKMPADMAERSYGILHTAEQSCFVIVRAGEIKAKHGTLYQSDESGTSMALSLHNAHYERGRNADIVKVQGIEGVYIINTLATDPDGPDLDDELESGLEYSEQEPKPTELTTKISFDKGGKWRYMTPPAVDSTGVHYPGCTTMNKCYLHLFFKGNPRKYSPIYSVSSATGLILATGVVGTAYNEDMETDEVGTYFSRDAGRTWSEIRKGSSIYEISDHGALLVVAPDGIRTSQIFYSWDEGLTWKTANLPVPLEVTSIRTDPKSSSIHFVVLGRNTAGEGASVTLDFDSLHTRECVNEDKAGATASDYELWSPRDPDGGAESTCVLGRTVVYTRRKQKAGCHNGVERERTTVRKNCRCTKSDFECDAGFEMNALGSKCVAQKVEDQSADKAAAKTAAFENDMLALYHEPETLLADMCSKYPDQETLYAPSGYRRVPGDTCKGGINLHEKTLQCAAGVVSIHGFGVLVVLIILALVMACATVLSRHERFQFFLRNMGAAELPYVKYIFLGEDGQNRPESVFDEDFALVDEDDEAQALPDVTEGYDKHFERKSKQQSGGNPYDNPYGGGGMSFTTSNAGASTSKDTVASNDPFNPVVAAVTDAEIDDCFDQDLDEESLFDTK